MFSLIVVLITIALVAALAAVSMYYGGPIYYEYQNRAHAAQILSEGTQVRGAAELYRADKGDSAQNLNDLISGKYLQNGIQASAWASIVNGYAQRTGDISDVECEMANHTLGVQGIPSCDDPRYAKRIVCCKIEGPQSPWNAGSGGAVEVPPAP